MSNFSVTCGVHIITLWVSSDIGSEAVPRALLRIRCVYVLGDDSQLSVQCQYRACTGVRRVSCPPSLTIGL